MTSLTRRYRFSASHRLHSEQLSPAENACLFGKCNNPHGHGHDYGLEVTVTGEPDPVSGLLVPLAVLDRLVDQHVIRLFAWRNMNLDIPQFQNLPATTENVALTILHLLEQHWPEYLGESSSCLARVYIQETDRNGFEVLAGLAPSHVSHRHQVESVVHA